MNKETNRLFYPTVTQIIGRQTVEQMLSIPAAVLNKAAMRGTKLHAYCTAYSKGLFLPDIEDEYLPYYEAFKEWGNANVSKLLLANERLYDDDRKFSGEFDMIVEMKDGAKALIDLKTSARESVTWKIQLAAYAHLCDLKGYEYDRTFILHLRKKEDKKGENSEGYFPQVEATTLHIQSLTTSWDIFESCLNCYNYFHKKD